MGEVKDLSQAKVARVLGGDIEDTEFEVLGKRFEELSAELSTKEYQIELSQDEIKFLTMDLLPSVKWQGQQAWDIAESQKVIAEAKPGVNGLTKVVVRSTFQMIATHTFEGVDNVFVVKELLSKIATVIQKEVAKDDQTLQDAGFELQAAEQGILPETAMANALQANVEG